MQKRGLGKGLAALISESLVEADEQAQVRSIPLSAISASPVQPRTLFDPIKLEELAESIRQHGVLQPLLVRRIAHEKYQLIAGERRYRAALAAGIAEAPALIKECTDREQLEMAIVENLQREDIGALEAARAYRRMSDEFDMTQEAIAARVGKSRAAVANTLGLLDLPDEVQESLETGSITEGHARALKGLKDAPALLEAWRTTVRKNLSVRAAEKLVRDMRARPGTITVGSRKRKAAIKETNVALFDANAEHLVTLLQEKLGTRVVLRRSAGEAGRIELEYYSNEDLERIFECLLG